MVHNSLLLTSTLSHTNPAHILSPFLIQIHVNISSHPPLDLPHGLFLQVFLPKFHSISRPSYACFIPRPSLSNNIQNKLKILKSSPYAVLSASCQFLLHRPKFSPQHIARKHPQIILFSQRYRPSCTEQVQLYFFIF